MQRESIPSCPMSCPFPECNLPEDSTSCLGEGRAGGSPEGRSGGEPCPGRGLGVGGVPPGADFFFSYVRWAAGSPARSGWTPPRSPSICLDLGWVFRGVWRSQRRTQDASSTDPARCDSLWAKVFPVLISTTVDQAVLCGAGCWGAGEHALGRQQQHLDGFHSDGA